MTKVITGLEEVFGTVPLPLLEVWGWFAYFVGLLLAICAFGGFTFRVGNHWGLGRARQGWDSKAFLSVPLTFVLIIATGYLGSFIVLVQGAQTFESLKDLVVLLCIVLFGYPALIAVPPAYMLSDLIEGVPPDFVWNWVEGYFFWAAFVWMAFQLIGRNPDFRQAATWRRYGVFVALIMLFDPVMWGFICSEKFTSAISYRYISSALAFTLMVTWVLAPPAFLLALPLARRFGWFWAETPGRIRERALGSSEWIWTTGCGETQRSTSPVPGGLPIRVFIFAPFIALVLLMVGATAIVALQAADDDAAMLATRLHHEASASIRKGLDSYLARSQSPMDAERRDALISLLRGHAIGTNGRAFILDRSGRTIASSGPDGDPVVASAVAALARYTGSSGLTAAAIEFQFDHVTTRPLSRETWLTYATAYGDDSSGRHWILVTAMPQSFYLAGLRVANSRSAMMFALALVLSLVLAAALASVVTAPLRRMARATAMMSGGDLSVRIEGSRVEELHALADSFNDMAARLETLLDELRRSATYLTEAERLSQTGCWAMNIKTGEEFWSPGAWRILGPDPATTQPSYQAFLELVHPDDRASLAEERARAILHKEPYEVSFRATLRDGTIKHLRSTGVPVFKESAEVVEYIGVTMDETERVRANAAMQETQAELERVARLTTMGELAGSIAHEINQPLAAVVLSGHAALRWLTHVPPNLDQTREALNRIIGDGRRASAVIDRVRALLRHRTPEHADFDMNEAIGEVLELATGALYGRAVTVQTVLATELPLAWGDRIQLQQAIMNLIINAADAMSSVTDRPRIIWIGSKREDSGCIQVTVKDSGTGIDEAVRHRIFDALFTTKANGMGMGLSICRRIIEAHGGRLWASPATPHGTSFQFTVPSAVAAERASSE